MSDLFHQFVPLCRGSLSEQLHLELPTDRHPKPFNSIRSQSHPGWNAPGSTARFLSILLPITKPSPRIKNVSSDLSISSKPPFTACKAQILLRYASTHCISDQWLVNARPAHVAITYDHMVKLYLASECCVCYLFTYWRGSSQGNAIFSTLCPSRSKPSFTAYKAQILLRLDSMYIRPVTR